MPVAFVSSYHLALDSIYVPRAWHQVQERGEFIVPPKDRTRPPRDHEVTALRVFIYTSLMTSFG